MNKRRRSEIIDLNTGKTYINESSVEKDIGISRYYVHKSLMNKIPVKGHMFAHNSYGMNIEDIKNIYMQNFNNKLTRSNKWRILTKLAAEQTQI